MEELNRVLTKLNILSSELKSECIQEVMVLTKRIPKSPEYEELWTEIAQVLWQHLQTGLDKFDDQLLCATCFYSLLTLTNREQLFLKEILEIINHEIELKENDNRKSLKTTQVVSLMYGIFQSSFLSQVKEISHIKAVLDATFKLLTIMAYEYSRFTFIVFKIISSFKKICNSKLQDSLFNKENNVILLNLVNHNWENPISGVRDLNKIVFQTVISVIDDDLFKVVLEEVSSFYWNKAKYLMLAEIICVKGYVIISRECIDGIVSSLSKPGLVSAGADLYFAILNKCKSEEEWCALFKKPVVDLLSTSSKKTIENFSNYWCLETFGRFGGKVLDMLIIEVQSIRKTEQRLYSSLSIMKQAFKIGYIEISWCLENDSYLKQVILDSLDHCNEPIRIMAFHNLCSSKDDRDFYVTYTQGESALDYLKNNVNSDCTTLRISLLSNISKIFTRLHASYINYWKFAQQSQRKFNYEELQQYCKSFQELIIKNLEVQGNYQRKITTVKMAHIFMNVFSNEPKHKQATKCERTIIEMLKAENMWLMDKRNVIDSLLKLLKDPADDIRDNTVQLLLVHYSKQLREEVTFNLLIEDALKAMSSKFFYEISCGKSAFKLITKLLLQESQPQGTFTTALDVYNFARNGIMAEHTLNRNVLESIQEGKQLHSFITILHTVLEECHKRNSEIEISNESALELLVVLEEISKQFAWEEDSTSSDFSKMNDMIENIISASGKSARNVETSISGLHQLVLNCLWLNVKAACDLSSLLIRCQKEDTQMDICVKALDIMSHVLETCRHKGAIEAAGAALGLSFQHLTSLPENKEISKLPFVYLKNKLNELISEAGRMASVTRRGAGLSIMVHRIVSSDAKRGKPLFHFFMKTILDTCNNSEDVSSVLDNAQNTDNEKDMPKAIYIHFLTRIVTDSSLASDMMFYSAELAELAFGNLTSPHWQIRNAALQLYGALIQKLIGQKKASGTDDDDDETIATVACDELRTHSPKLWDYILKQITNREFDGKLQYHSDLVPILNILANTARRYNFSSDMMVQRKADSDLLENLMRILDSPIHTVRRLTAKCIYKMYSFPDIYDNLMEQKCCTENYIHGSLMLIANCHKLYGSNRLYDDYFTRLKIKYSNIPNGNHSYVCKEIYEHLFYDSEIDMKQVEEAFIELDTNTHAPGIHYWAYKRFQKSLYNTSWDVIPGIVNTLLPREDFDTTCEILLLKIENSVEIPFLSVRGLIDILLKSEEKDTSGILWCVIYSISKVSRNTLQEYYMTIMECFEKLMKNCHMETVIYKFRYMILCAARIAESYDHMSEITKSLSLFMDPETADVEMRIIVAQALNELCFNVKKSSSQDIKIMMLYSVIILLQDENENVRKVSADFYNVLRRSQRPTEIEFRNYVYLPKHPFVCLSKILDIEFLSYFGYFLLKEEEVPVQTVVELVSQLSDFLVKMSKSKTIDKYNPFANNSINIYLEPNVLKDLLENLNKLFELK